MGGLTMGKVRILDDHLANQIAAGEVVERPASIVKELVENAIDAQATRIQIQLEEGGISTIRVSDNGEGMDKEDAQLAFLRHATSKIERKRDLFSIRTLGFRGEALPSIAAVAKVTLTTVHNPAKLAVKIEVNGGELQTYEDTARAQGTDVVVRELFYNTPARLKYLKSVSTEVSHVADVVGRLALAHPHISFSLRHQERELFHTAGDGKVMHVLHALYGKQVVAHMVSLAAEDADFRVASFVTKPEITRSSRSYLTLIVNGRFVRSVPLAQSVLKAYGTLLPNGRYPLGVVQVEMDPKIIDVNVHPAKLEVRMSKEKECCQLIKETIQQALQKQSLVPQVARTPPISKGTQAELYWNLSQTPSMHPASQVKEEGGVWVSSLPQVAPTPIPIQQQLEPVQAAGKQKEKRRLPEMTPLAQIHGTYIVAQSSDGFYLLDQHAAHERIYYEIFSQKMKEENQRQQLLLTPLPVECSPAQAQIVGSYVGDLHRWGLEIEPFGGSTFLVRSYPSWFPQAEAESLIHEIIEWLKAQGKVDTAQLRDAGAKMMSCKAAIKANRHLGRAEMEALLQQLHACENPFTCPHGRPILVHFSTYELEKMFKRV
jgi:DNA mismatch repair protein MutL